MSINIALEQYGLTQKQSQIYVACLELGRAPVLRIATKASIKRPTTYVILNELVEDGLIQLVPRGGTRLYQAIDPKILLERMQAKTELLSESLPQLRALLNTTVNKPKVRFYEGKRAIFELYEREIFQSKKVYGLASMQDFFAIFSTHEMTKLLNVMQKNSLELVELIDDSKDSNWYIEQKIDRGLGVTKILPSQFNFTVDFLLFDNTVVTISLKNMVAVVIEDSSIYEAQLQLFNFLYNSID